MFVITHNNYVVGSTTNTHEWVTGLRECETKMRERERERDRERERERERECEISKQ